MPFNFQLWDRIRAFAKAGNIHRTDNIYQDQDSLEKILQGGNFADLSKSSALLEQTNLQINRLERYKDYDMMDEVGEIFLALDMYADEASLVDPERKHSVIVKAKNLRVRKAIEDFLYNTIMIDSKIRPIVRYLCKMGDFPAEIIPTQNRDGVASFRPINVYNFTRIQTRYGDLVGFYFQDPTSGGPVFLHPWQVVHMRLTTFETVYSPYGRSILDGGRKDFKRLRLMEDAALVYRITRAPEKRVFSVPVGNIPPKDVQLYIELIARQFKKVKFVDPATGQVNERYNPLIQDDDFFLPKRPDGQGPTIDTLPGAENLDKIADIEYFKKKMVAGLKIPFGRLGIGEAAAPDGKTLSQVSPEFAKNIQWIQREVVAGLKKLVTVHLALRGHSLEEIKNFDLSMTAASAIDELYRIEVWNTRADIISGLKETGLFPDEWILENFTDMSKDEIKQMQSVNSMKKDLARLRAESNLTLDQKMLIEAYEGFIERQAIGISNPVEINSNVEYLVNSNELDGLPSKGSKDLLVEVSVSEDIVKELKEETERLLEGGVEGGDPYIQSIASAILTDQEKEQQVISEAVESIANSERDGEVE